MGQIADNMIEGRCCALCGQYFINRMTEELFEHGYPVACDECYESDCGYEPCNELATTDIE